MRLITQPCGHKVKVTVQGHEFEPCICICSISPLPLKEFSLNFSQIFISVSLCAERLTRPCQLKVKATIQGRKFKLGICVCSISPLSLKGFSLNFGQMFTLKRRCAELNHANSRSRSQLKVSCLSLVFDVISISPLPLKQFSFNFGQMLILESGMTNL